MASQVVEADLRTVTYYHAPSDNRVVAILIKGDFDEFEKFPPFMDTEEERQHVREAYSVADPMLERTTKAHITDDSWPLQLVILQREPGGTTNPHYHIPDEELPPLPTRHQMLICQRGRARIGVYTTEGDALGDVILEKDDIILMLEGHDIEFLESGSRLVEVKQGPFPGTDEADKVDLRIVRG